MYIFSADAVAARQVEEVAKGQKVPFIIYIHFQDLFGAEQLAKIYLMKAGFTEISIHKRKAVSPELLADERVIAADKALKEAVETGYTIQMFDDF